MLLATIREAPKPLKEIKIMAKYVDGFVIPVPKHKLDAYLAMAQQSARIWREYGALDYKECVLEDATGESVMPFPKGIGAKPDETVVFSWITYESRAQRDAANKKIMADPRIREMCNGDNTPFDSERMLYSGFDVVVDGLAE